MKKLLVALTTAFLVLPAYAVAGDTAQDQAVGAQTRSALELQRSGKAASNTPRPMSGAVAERTYQRYSDSFSHPIPESFKDKEQEFVRGSQ